MLRIAGSNVEDFSYSPNRLYVTFTSEMYTHYMGANEYHYL